MTSLENVLDTIRKMTASVRSGLGDPWSEEGRYGWWVLALGDGFDDAPLEDRDQIRELLRDQVEAAGVILAEYVWVFDDSGQAQLVLATLPTKDRAERVAEQLRGKGLLIRVSRETI